MKYIIYESALTSSIENAKSNGDVVEFITVLQEADVKNRNGRIYPKSVIEEGLKGPMIQEKLARHSLFGEAGHPYSQEVSRQTQVDLRNAAFRIEDFWWEGNLLKGRCRTLDTALGRDMAGLIKEGCELSFSMRGQGNVTRDPYRDALVVKSPLMIITYDWVYLPSHDKAYMESICEETKASMFNTHAYENMATALNESCNLYENGSLVALESEKPVEKPLKDYYKNYTKKFKLLDEAYSYDPTDVVKEMTNTYVILENATEMKKVAKEDYILKNIRSSIKEGCDGIAALDMPRSTTPLTSEEKAEQNYTSDDLVQAQQIGVDVKSSTTNEATTDPNNAADAYVDQYGITTDGEAKPIGIEDHKEDEKDIKLPEGTLERKPEIEDLTTNESASSVVKEVGKIVASGILGAGAAAGGFTAATALKNPELFQAHSVEIPAAASIVGGASGIAAAGIHSAISKKNKGISMKEEFYKFYNMIKDETNLTEEADIIERALSYTDYMSEDCAYLFKTLSKKGAK